VFRIFNRKTIANEKYMSRKQDEKCWKFFFVNDGVLVKGRKEKRFSPT
jgi:hypothetical protein